MDKKAQQLVLKLNALRDEGKDGKAIVQYLGEWRSQNATVTDFSKLYFDRLPLVGADLSGLNLTDCRFRGSNLTSANFNGATLRHCQFVDWQNLATRAANANFSAADAASAVFACDLSGARFNGATLTDANLDGCSIRGAHFDHAHLAGANLRNVDADAATRFQQLQSVDGCKIDRYTLACLSPDGSGLTVGNQMLMNVFDDTAALRSQFGGIWTWMHLLSLLIFLAPYGWFLASQWTVATFRTPDEQANTMSLIEALARYIVRGGESWQTTWRPNWGPFISFLFVFCYNAVRACLLWKTKKLETQQEVSGLPVRFSLSEPTIVSIPVVGSWPVRLWFRLTQVNRYGFWISMALILYNTFHFLTMRIAIAT